MNQLLKEINEGLKKSNPLVKDNFITFQHEGNEYHIYKNRLLFSIFCALTAIFIIWK